jgi:pimeloyl-ACP methyl ester carboxylesterase
MADTRTDSGATLARTLLMACLITWLPGTAWSADVPIPEYKPANECVVLLHGLSRTDFSMGKMANVLSERGYADSNVHYNSREHNIEELAALAISQGLQDCRALEAQRIHFVTHSLGGILVRYYLQHNEVPELGRVVMLAPPNHGSQIIDIFGDIPGFDLFSGEPASQLGTRGPESVPAKLPPVDFELGVIAGTRSISPIFSFALPDRDDGKVTVESTKVDGMRDFIEMPFNHTFIMRSNAVIEQVIHFLQNGSFDHSATNQEM